MDTTKLKILIEDYVDACVKYELAWGMWTQRDEKADAMMKARANLCAYIHDIEMAYALLVYLKELGHDA